MSASRLWSLAQPVCWPQTLPVGISYGVEDFIRAHAHTRSTPTCPYTRAQQTHMYIFNFLHTI